MLTSKDKLVIANACTTDARKLRTLNAICRDTLYETHERTQQRATLVRHMKMFRDMGGQVVAIESGRDCDGVRYFGRKHLIESTVKAYDELHDHISDWADGPFYLSLMWLSEAEFVKYESRDLGMEAFEDGHAHVIYT